MRQKYDVDTKLIFHIGDPIEHSLSPFVHNAMYDLANVDAVCMPVLVKKGNLAEFIQAVKEVLSTLESITFVSAIGDFLYIRFKS